jgi:hypothetical protein
VGGGDRRECAVATDGLIEIVDNGAAIDEDVTIVEYQRWDTPQRIGGSHLGSIVEP